MSSQKISSIFKVDRLSVITIKKKDRRHNITAESQSLHKFNRLPLDITQLLALYLSVGNIRNFCLLNRKLKLNIFDDQLFIKYLAQQRLTDDISRLTINAKIYRQLYISYLPTTAKKGYEKLAKYLLEHKKYDNAVIQYTLEMAAKKGYLNIVEYLTTDREIEHSYMSRILSIASGKGHLHIVKYLLSHLIAVNRQNEDYQITVLKSSIRGGHLAIVQYLVPKSIDVRNNSDFLDVAAEYGKLDIFKYLVCQGADIHARNNLTIRTAAMEGRLNIIEYLISCYKAGKINFVPLIDDALSEAASRGHLHVIKYLISEGATTLIDDLTLISACVGGDLETVEYILDNGANIDAQNGNPMIESYREHQYHIMECLISRGANIHINDDFVIKEILANDDLVTLEDLGFLKSNAENQTIISYARECESKKILTYMKGKSLDK